MSALLRYGPMADHISIFRVIFDVSRIGFARMAAADVWAARTLGSTEGGAARIRRIRERDAAAASLLRRLAA